jgi:hypothetical protein
MLIVIGKTADYPVGATQECTYTGVRHNPSFPTFRSFLEVCPQRILLRPSPGPRSFLKEEKDAPSAAIIHVARSFKDYAPSWCVCQ